MLRLLYWLSGGDDNNETICQPEAAKRLLVLILLRRGECFLIVWPHRLWSVHSTPKWIPTYGTLASFRWQKVTFNRNQPREETLILAYLFRDEISFPELWPTNPVLMVSITNDRSLDRWWPMWKPLIIQVTWVLIFWWTLLMKSEWKAAIYWANSSRASQSVIVHSLCFHVPLVD